MNPWPDTAMVTSADGTSIGCAEIGNGPSKVVVVHGVLDTAQGWSKVAEALAAQCTCYVMDRRGRGRSGDGDNYSFKREIEDIGAVLRIVGPHCYVLGHSLGAIYALEAARDYPLAGLILYEPPLHFRSFREVVDNLRALTAQGRFEDAAAVFFTEEVKLSRNALAAFKLTPGWREIARLAPTLVREWDAVFAFNPSVERYGGLSIPTLLLSGTETRKYPRFATDDLERLMPNARIATLNGQGHMANVIAPHVVAEHVAAFIRERN